MTQNETLEILKQGRNVFLTGEPGAGKSYTIDLFTDWLEGMGIRYAVTASTGIAASHIQGTTIHSFCGMGIQRNLTEEQLNRIVFNHWKREAILPVKVLIIDEVSMLDAVNINDVDRILRAMHGNEQPFGGIQVVFVGDFFQLPPVSKDKTAQFAFESEAWNRANLRVCYLTEQHRQSDPEFLDILTNMRSGKLTEEQKARLLECQTKEPPKTILFTHNADVDHINRVELAKIEGNSRTYNMQSSGIDFLVENLKKNCLSPEKLELKVGAVVMFTRNRTDEGYVNGTIGEVIDLTPGFPVVRTSDGVVVVVKPAVWEHIEKDVVKAHIEQFPLRLAWAITVHKSQGMSLDSASIDLRNAFEFGQGYVAISRVRSLAGLHLKGANEGAFNVHPLVLQKDTEFKFLSNNPS